MTDIPDSPEVTEEPAGDPQLTGRAVLGESKVVQAAAREVNKLIRANQVNRRWRIALTAAVAVLVLVVAGLGVVAVSLHRQAIATCEAGNQFRADTTKIWTEVITLSVQGNSSPAAKRQAEEFLVFVKKVDTQRSCGGLLP